MSDDLHKYPGNMKHYNVDEATVTHLRIIADQAELIQRLVDALAPVHGGYTDYTDVQYALQCAAAAGFKPYEQ